MFTVCHPNLIALIELLYRLVDRSYGRDSSGKVWLSNLRRFVLGMAVLLQFKMVESSV